jgi:hypothetical protein
MTLEHPSSVILDMMIWMRKVYAAPSVDCVNRAQFVKRFMLQFGALEYRGKWCLLFDSGSSSLQNTYLKQERVLWAGAPGSITSSARCPTCGFSPPSQRQSSFSASSAGGGVSGSNGGRGGRGGRGHGGRGGRGGKGGRGTKRQASSSKGICNPYKDASLGPCTFKNCIFDHVCQGCGSTEHILRDCPAK